MTVRTRASRNRKTMAVQADKLELYERSVQDPESDVELFARWFKRLRGRVPLSLREDFCGTAVLCATWARSHPERRALGIDLDADTLAWGRRRHVDVDPAIADRVELRQADVLAGVGEPTDITCALNFSYCTFKDRKVLLAYFEAVRRRLVEDGVFVLDVYGGPESMSEEQNENDIGDFLYVWEQAEFCALTHNTLCHIHFHFPDGSRMKRAFTYDWRLWTVPELRDLLYEAGFSRVRLLWERTGPKGEETGVFYEPKRVENQQAWWTYIFAER